MSIIYDALKKVEKTASPQNGGPAPKKTGYRIYFFYLIIAGLGIIVANLFFNFMPVFFKRGVVPKIAPSPAPSLQPQAQIEPVTVIAPEAIAARQEPAEPPNFVLNGIFFSEGQGYALINNQIVRQGDLVSGATVVMITENEAELSFQGSTIKLAVELR